MLLEIAISLWIWKSRVNEFADGLCVGMRKKTTVKRSVCSRVLYNVQIVMLFPKMTDGTDWGGIDQDA